MLGNNSLWLLFFYSREVEIIKEVRYSSYNLLFCLVDFFWVF